jgi:hypothetical protein
LRGFTSMFTKKVSQHFLFFVMSLSLLVSGQHWFYRMSL